MTEYDVREVLAGRDPPIGVSHQQLMKWRDWGLLEQGRDGRWPSNTVEKVVRIHELGKTVDSLARRVILLNAESIRVIPLAPGQEESGESSEAFFSGATKAIAASND